MNILSKRSRFASNPIHEEDDLAERLKRSGRNIIKLSTGDPAVYFPTPKYIIKAYIEALREGRTYYSRAEGTEALVDAVSNRYRRMYRIDLNQKDIIVTQGLSEALYFINSSIIDEGNTAFIFRPYYPAYMSNLYLCGGRCALGDYDEGRGWSIDVQKAAASIKRLKKTSRGKGLKYIIITNPNNPTGTVLQKKALEDIVSLANESGLLLISDEIYDEIIFNNARFTSVSKLAAGIPHMILNGASKNFDATGFRIGFVIIPESDPQSEKIKEKIGEYAKVRLSSNTPAEFACAEAMNNVVEHRRSIRYMVAQISDRVNHAVKLLDENSHIDTVRPNGAFYLFPKVDFGRMRLKDDVDFAKKLLLEESLQVTRGSGFGSPGHIRIVSLAPKKILEYAIDRINQFCIKNSKR